MPFKLFLPYFLVLLLALIAGLNFFAFKFSWYFYHWWFDLLMHFLGGLFIGLTVWWLFQLVVKYYSSRPLSRWLIFGLQLGMVLLLGLMWELFEFRIDEYWQTHLNIKLTELLQDNRFDTFSDLLFAILGGLLAGRMSWFLGREKEIFNKVKIIENHES